MFRLLRSHSLPMQLMLPIVAFVPYLVLFFTDQLPRPVIHNAQGWLYHEWQELITGNPWLFLILGWLINLLIAFIINWINIRFEVVGKRTVYISYLFILIVLTPLGFHSLHPGMLGGIFLLFSLVFLFLVYHNSQSQAYIFNAGLFWGIASVIYPPLLAMLPIYILGARFVKYTSWKDFILLFSGLLAPVSLWLGYAYLKDIFRFQWLSLLQWAEIRSTWPPDLPGNKVLWYIFFGTLFLVFILNMSLYRVKKDVGRRVLTLMGQLLWICPLTLLLFERVSVEILWVALVPLTFFFSVAAFNTRSPWLSDLGLVIIFIFLAAFQLNLLL